VKPKNFPKAEAINSQVSLRELSKTFQSLHSIAIVWIILEIPEVKLKLLIFEPHPIKAMDATVVVSKAITAPHDFKIF